MGTLSDIVKGEFEKFQQASSSKNVVMEGSPIGPCGAFSDLRYDIMEAGKDGKPIHKIATVNIEDMMGGYRITISYRQKWYPNFSMHAENMAAAIRKLEKGYTKYQVIINKKIPN